MNRARALALLLLLAPACSETAQDPPPAAEAHASDAEGSGSGGTGEPHEDGSGGGTGDDDTSGDEPEAAPGGGEPASEGATSEHADPLARARQELEHALAERQRARSEEREKILAARTAAEQARAELEARLSSIEALEGRIDRRLGVGKIARQRRLERLSALAGLVAGMPPQAGAEIVAQMPDEDAQDLLLAVAQKNDRRAAKLLSLMPPHRAAALGQRYLDTDPEALPLPDGHGASEPPPADGASAPTPTATAAATPDAKADTKTDDGAAGQGADKEDT